MAHVLVTYRIPDSGIKLLKEAGHTVTVRQEESLIDPEELMAAVKEYDAIICLLTDTFNAEVISKAGPQLKIIANYAVGYDNIDVATATKRGIFVSNTPDVLTTSVAEHTLALMLAVARRVVEGDRFTRAGEYHGWRPLLLLGTSLMGKTLGVVGVGRIGQQVAQYATGMGMKIAYHDLAPNDVMDTKWQASYYETLDELLAKVDVLSLHVPLLPTTHHLINAERLRLMKPTAFLINTARGPVVDEQALLAALNDRLIAGAALDVFEHEPELTAGLSDCPHIVLTPHIGSATSEAREMMSLLVAKNVIAVLEGKEPVTPVRVSL